MRMSLTQIVGGYGGPRGGMGYFVEYPERAAEAGRKDGRIFKNSPERASEAGRKHGLVSHKGRSCSATSRFVRGIEKSTPE